jgi:DNA-binding phage protein
VTDFAAAFRAAIAAAGYEHPTAAAARAGVSRGNFYRYLTGRPRPYWQSVAGLIETLDLPLEFFFPEARVLDAADRLRATRR